MRTPTWKQTLESLDKGKPVKSIPYYNTKYLLEEAQELMEDMGIAYTLENQVLIATLMAHVGGAK
jgi:hypothetical protein